MTTQQKTAIVRKASRQIEDMVPFMWDMYPDMSKDVVKAVLEVAEAATKK